MLEAILTAGGTGKHYPNSGPGPQTLLFGDTEEGYFGRVPLNEMVTSNDVSSQLGITGYRSPSYWLKFYRKKEVLFIGVEGTLGSGWNAVYNAGLIYGVNGNGDYPTATPTNQERILRQGKWGYIVRALRSTDVSPAAVGRTPEPGAEVAMLRKTFTNGAYGSQLWDKVALFIDTAVRERYNADLSITMKINTTFGYSTESPSNSTNVYPVLQLTSLEGRILPATSVQGALAAPYANEAVITVDPALTYPVQPLLISNAGLLLSVDATATYAETVVPISNMTARIPVADTVTPNIIFTPNEV